MCALRSLAPAVFVLSALACQPATTDPAPTDTPLPRQLKDLAFSRVEWTEGPVAREHGALFVSDDAANVFVLGGGGYPNVPEQEVFDDAWRLDVDSGVWTAWSVSGDVPPPAGSRRAAQGEGNIGYLHGGYLDDFITTDALYRVDLDSGVISELTQTNPRPLSRSLHAFAFDEASQRFVVFGGFHSAAGGQALLGDTWVGELVAGSDVVIWTELQTAGPSARYGMFAGLDAAPARLVVFSGAGMPTADDPINASADVWALTLDDAPAWQQLTPTGTAPRGRRNGCGVLDPITRGLFVFGGTADGLTTEPEASLLDLEASRWIAAQSGDAPPPRSSGFGAPWPGGGFVCGFGNDDATYRDLFFLR